MSNETCMTRRHSKCNSFLAFVKLGTGLVCVPAIQHTSDPLPPCRTFGELKPFDSYSCDTSKHDGFVVLFRHVSTTGSCVPCCQILAKTIVTGWSLFGPIMLVMLQVVLSSPHLGNVRFLWKKWKLLRAMMCVGRYMLGTYVVLASHCILMDKGKTIEGSSIHNRWHGTVIWAKHSDRPDLAV